MRYEVKLVGVEHDLARVRGELSLLPHALRPLHAPRTVQSVYFDTLENRAVEENLAGISKRTKLRLRWYGRHEREVMAQFECKQRESGLGSKLVHRLVQAIDVGGRRRHEFVREVRRQLPPKLRGALDGQAPAQWIRYDREYLGSHDGSLRVTIDRHLAAFDQRGGNRLQCRFATTLPPLLIVELKAAADARDSIERCVQGLGLPPSKCSKFVMASSPDEVPQPSEFW